MVSFKPSKKAMTGVLRGSGMSVRQTPVRRAKKMTWSILPSANALIGLLGMIPRRVSLRVGFCRALAIWASMSWAPLSRSLVLVSWGRPAPGLKALARIRPTLMAMTVVVM